MLSCNATCLALGDLDFQEYRLNNVDLSSHEEWIEKLDEIDFLNISLKLSES